MSALETKIVKRIKTTGPISVADYMAECLFHPEHGYYNHVEPFGSRGDFITAPDISQMFGEITGLWLVQMWSEMGEPEQFNLCELGPGRGTWIRDIVRTMRQANPRCLQAAQLRLIEKSQRLTRIQQEALASLDSKCTWLKTIDGLASGPTIFIANELFDALPIRQFVKYNKHWVERLIDIDDGDNLIFVPGTAKIDENILPQSSANAESGSIFEYGPAREALCQQVSERVAANGGGALVVDYGHTRSAIGETLQAVQNHEYRNIFQNPGMADLTSHVDFEALNLTANNSGAQIHEVITQAEFLLANGIIERAGVLGSGKSTETQKSLVDAVNRLAGNGDGQMGDLFKVMCLTQTAVKAPRPFKRST